MTCQNTIQQADSLQREGQLVPALQVYSSNYNKNPSTELSYKIASSYALLWTKQMRDSAFKYLNKALYNNNELEAIYDPTFLSLIDDHRWLEIEENQLDKYEALNGSIKNKAFAKALFRMIIKDQGFMYTGNLERRKYMRNGGQFSTTAIYPILAMEEQNHHENEILLFKLIETYGWPTATSVTEYAAAGAALIINHTDYETRSKYFPLLEKAFRQGEAQPLRYAKMRDRLLIEEGKEQLYGTQWKFENSKKIPQPIKKPSFVDKRRAAIGLGPLQEYLKERFDIDWNIKQEN